jgi:DNA replication protein DnaC
VKHAEEYVILDENLADLVGEPAWRGIAWAMPGEEHVDQWELGRREQNVKNLHWQLPQRYRDYTFDTLREQAGNRKALEACREFSPGKNLYIHGPAGNGKTHLAVATGLSLVGALTVQFWGVAKLFSTLRLAAIGEEARPDLYRPDVLILDDLGKVKATEFVFQEFYAVLEQRWAEQQTTIFTANHKPSESASQLAPDPQSAAAILSRMASGVVIEVKGRDERLGQ